MAAARMREARVLRSRHGERTQAWTAGPVPRTVRVQVKLITPRASAATAKAVQEMVAAAPAGANAAAAKVPGIAARHIAVNTIRPRDRWANHWRCRRRRRRTDPGSTPIATGSRQALWRVDTVERRAAGDGKLPARGRVTARSQASRGAATRRGHRPSGPWTANKSGVWSHRPRAASASPGSMPEDGAGQVPTRSSASDSPRAARTAPGSREDGRAASSTTAIAPLPVSARAWMTIAVAATCRDSTTVGRIRRSARGSLCWASTIRSGVWVSSGWIHQWTAIGPSLAATARDLISGGVGPAGFTSATSRSPVRCRPGATKARRPRARSRVATIANTNKTIAAPAAIIPAIMEWILAGRGGPVNGRKHPQFTY